PFLLVGQLLVELRERALALGVDEEPGGPEHGVVSGGAVDRPVFGEALIRLEDLLGHDPGVGRRLAKAFEVSVRIPEPVRMIHPHAVQDPALEPGQDQAMSVLEHPRIADAETGQRADIEETAIVHIPGGGLPAGQAVSLQLEDGIEALGSALTAATVSSSARATSRRRRRRAASRRRNAARALSRSSAPSRSSGSSSGSACKPAATASRSAEAAPRGIARSTCARALAATGKRCSK